MSVFDTVNSGLGNYQLQSPTVQIPSFNYVPQQPVSNSSNGLFGSILSGLFGLGSSMLTNRYNQNQQEQAFQQNLELSRYNADMQWQYNKRAWDMQNAYNTPAAQMERFKAAGLNPNLIYGNGTNGNASGAPAYNIDNAKKIASVGQNPAASMIEVVGMLQNILMNDSILRKQEAETKKIDAYSGR